MIGDAALRPRVEETAPPVLAPGVALISLAYKAGDEEEHAREEQEGKRGPPKAERFSPKVSGLAVSVESLAALDESSGHKTGRNSLEHKRNPGEDSASQRGDPREERE